MDEDKRVKIDEWAASKARLKQDIPKKEIEKLNDYARDRYAYLRGMHQHALEPHWGFAIPMVHIVEKVGADVDRVAAMIENETEDGKTAAAQFRDAIATRDDDDDSID